jgi:hypothetical protein
VIAEKRASGKIKQREIKNEGVWDIAESSSRIYGTIKRISNDGEISL